MKIVRTGWTVVVAALLLALGARSLFSGHDESPLPAGTADTGDPLETTAFAVG